MKKLRVNSHSTNMQAAQVAREAGMPNHSFNHIKVPVSSKKILELKKDTLPQFLKMSMWSKTWKKWKSSSHRKDKYLLYSQPELERV